ncbi:hypothetical protein MOQ72_10775 [Saccharopolyspora sp. K220]|uniref:hypothetical protein n=1 Tax=Saccharopolyspora soli TaxID=2926618 RepID=UPI001F584D79|nr:hypothetical protein [Saccharopolyspora soli]MCI2417908.1 hypothetical protein [Saccharopolyspora soli]
MARRRLSGNDDLAGSDSRFGTARGRLLLIGLGALLVVVAVVIIGRGTGFQAPDGASDSWNGWPTRGDLAADEELRHQIDVRIGENAHLLWLGNVPSPNGRPPVPHAVVAIEEPQDQSSVRPSAPAQVYVAKYVRNQENPQWSGLQEVVPFHPADPGISVPDVGVLLRADLSEISVLSVSTPAPLAIEARADGVAVLPRTAPYGATGSCQQPIITIGDLVLLPWGAEPLRTPTGDRAIQNLTSLISGLTCARGGLERNSDLLVGSVGGPIAFNDTTGSLADWGGAPAEIVHVVLRVAGGDLEETLAVVQPGRPATIGVPLRTDGNNSSPPPVRVPGPSGATSILVVRNPEQLATIPQLPVQYGNRTTALYGPADGPVAVISLDQYGNPFEATVVD